MIKQFLALRYISLIAVIALFIGAALMFIIGALRTLDAIRVLVLDRALFNIPEHLDRGSVFPSPSSSP